MNKKELRTGWKLKHSITTIMESLLPANKNRDEVTLPHDAMISRGRGADEPSGTGEGFFKHENFEYALTFFMPLEEQSKVHYLNFDGMYMNASVILNGFYVTRHTNGYTPFTVNIDENLNFGSENTLCIQFRDAAAPFSRWYAGNGIYREAYMLTGEPLHIENDGIHVTSTVYDDSLAVLDIETKVRNADRLGKEAFCYITISEKDGDVVAKRRARFYVRPNGRVTVRQRVDLDDPKLWDVDTPNLYTCRCRIVDKTSGEEIDSDTATFGIRSLKLDSRNGLRVNQKSVKLKGGCLHHDNGVIGSVSVYDIELRRLRMLKAGGYNAVRTSHNIPSRAFLEACDEVGMYVMEEFTDVWTETKAVYDYAVHMPDNWEKDVEDAVRRDYNHPSVIMWSIGNEIPELGDPVAAQWGRKLTEKFRQLDPTRFVTNGVNVTVACMPQIERLLDEVLKDRDDGQDVGGINDLMNDSVGMMAMFSESPVTSEMTEESCDMLDLVGYNYTSERYEKEHDRYPYRVYFGSETWPRCLDVNWDIVKRNPYVIGDFCWTAWDYLGEVGVGREQIKADTNPFMAEYPWIAAYCSDFDLTGFRKPISYWREIVWGGRGHKPYIAVQPPEYYGKELFQGGWTWTGAKRSWSYEGLEGSRLIVEAYSDAEEAELFVNGLSKGRIPVKDDARAYYCKWDVEYEPGEISVTAYIDGKAVGEDVLKTVRDSAPVISADKTVLRKGTNDLCVVEIELRDTAGTLDMHDQREAVISVEGPVVLWGSGSADPKTEESYTDGRHKFYDGRMIAVVRAGEVPGNAAVTVRIGEEEHRVTLSVV